MRTSMFGVNAFIHNPMSTSAVLYLAAGLVTAILAVGAVLMGSLQPAQATAAFAAKTGLPCGRCHSGPSGGPLTSFGNAFHANGDKLPKSK